MRFLKYVLLLCAVLAAPAQAQIVFQDLTKLTSSQRQALYRVKTDLEQMLVFNAPVYIEIAAQPDLSCSGGSAVLAQAGPQYIYKNVAGLPQAGTWYPASLAVQLSKKAKTDLGAKASIAAQFNPLNQAGCSLSWYYGTASAGANQVSFYETMMHEIVHGLGFISFHSRTGQWYRGVNDIFSYYLGSGSGIYPVAWRVQPTAEQGAAQLQSNNVYWQGIKGQQFAALLKNTSGRPKMYAPLRYEAGSSISHFDISTKYAAEQDELMEPYATETVLSHLSAAVLCDIGWGLKTDYDSDGIDDCNDTQPLLAQVPVDDPDENDPDWPVESGGGSTNPVTELSNCTYALDAALPAIDLNDEGANACWSIASSEPLPAGLFKSRQGLVLAAAGDMNGDGYGDYWLASPKADVERNGKQLKAAGSVTLMSGKTNRPILSGAQVGDIANGHFGSQIVSNIDFDGDGCIDTFFSAPNETVTAELDGKKLKAAGAVYQYSPFQRDGDYCIWRDTLPERIYSGTQAQAKAGSALLFVDNGINEPTLLIGEPGRNVGVGLKRAGAVAGISASWKSDVFYGKAAGELAGSYLAQGPFDDAQTIVAVAAPGIKSGKQRGGIYWTNLNGELSANKLQPTLLPAHVRNCALNGPLATIGVNGGAILAAAAPNCRLSHTKQGAVWLFGFDNSLDVLAWPQSNLGLGISLLAADVSSDGIDDLIIGSAQAYADPRQAKPKVNAGSMIVYDPTKALVYYNGRTKNEQLGCALAAGFIDRDGRADLIVASCGRDGPKQTPFSAVEIFPGRLFK